MVPFQGVIAILLGCLTFFQWLRPEDEPNSQQEIDPGREWNGERQMGMSVHSVENMCVCVSVFTCETFFCRMCFSPTVRVNKIFYHFFISAFFVPPSNKKNGSTGRNWVVLSGTEENGIINYLVSADLRKESCSINEDCLSFSVDERVYTGSSRRPFIRPCKLTTEGHKLTSQDIFGAPSVFSLEQNVLLSSY